MKAVILAGGFGTRISEESHLRPKPLIEIGGKPILWHIMKILSAYGLRDFVICCGYKGYLIKEYFANYFLHTADVTFDVSQNAMVVHRTHAEPWKVTVVDTGMNTMTGGRLLRVKTYVEDERFFFTYGDGVANVDIDQLIRFHESHRRRATVTAMRPPARFGALEFDGNYVNKFVEKPKGEGGWVSGGFFILEPGVFDYLHEDQDVWEQEPLRKLADEGELVAFRHDGFWGAMDTVRDKNYLEELWTSGRAPWKVWE
jgi:glucose-1-phosphate cytidylyltransferase